MTVSPTARWRSIAAAFGGVGDANQPQVLHTSTAKFTDKTRECRRARTPAWPGSAPRRARARPADRPDSPVHAPRRPAALPFPPRRAVLPAGGPTRHRDNRLVGHLRGRRRVPDMDCVGTPTHTPTHTPTINSVPDTEFPRLVSPTSRHLEPRQMTSPIICMSPTRAGQTNNQRPPGVKRA